MSDAMAQAAAELAVQRSFYESIIPTIRHGTVTEINSSTWIHRVQMDGDAYSTQMHDLTAGGAFVGARASVLFAPPHGGLIVAVNRRQLGWQTWPVNWIAAIAGASIGNGTLIGSYQRRGASVDINIWLGFGSTTNGGTGAWTFGLPIPAVVDMGEQIMIVKASTTGGANWVGFAYISPNSIVIAPFLPFNSGVSFLGQVQNADASAAPGTGIPFISGNFTFTNGSNLVITGSYKAQTT